MLSTQFRKLYGQQLRNQIVNNQRTKQQHNNPNSLENNISIQYGGFNQQRISKKEALQKIFAQSPQKSLGQQKIIRNYNNINQNVSFTQPQIYNNQNKENHFRQEPPKQYLHNHSNLHQKNNRYQNKTSGNPIYNQFQQPINELTRKQEENNQLIESRLQSLKPFRHQARNLLQLQNQRSEQYQLKLQKQKSVQKFLKMQIQQAKRKKIQQQQRLKRQQQEEEQRQKQYLRQQQMRLLQQEKQKLFKIAQLNQENAKNLQIKRSLNQNISKNSRKVNFDKSNNNIISRIVPSKASINIDSPTLVTSKIKKTNRKRQANQNTRDRKFENFSKILTQMRDQVKQQGHLFEVQLQKLKLQTQNILHQKNKAKLEAKQLRQELRQKQFQDNKKLEEILTRNQKIPHIIKQECISCNCSSFQRCKGKLKTKAKPQNTQVNYHQQNIDDPFTYQNKNNKQNRSLCLDGISQRVQLSDKRQIRKLGLSQFYQQYKRHPNFDEFQNLSEKKKTNFAQDQTYSQIFSPQKLQFFKQKNNKICLEEKQRASTRLDNANTYQIQRQISNLLKERFEHRRGWAQIEIQTRSKQGPTSKTQHTKFSSHQDHIRQQQQNFQLIRQLNQKRLENLDFIHYKSS